MKKFLVKLMLNSLYGRFGLKHQTYKTEIVSKSKFTDISLKY
jgi:hypothetical protein